MPSQEHRKVNRKGLSLRASVACTSYDTSDSSVPVKTLNLSTKGALVESTDELFVDIVCRFNLVTSDGRNVLLQGRIVWVKAQEDGTYRAGVVFRNLSPEEEYIISLQLVRA